VGEGGLKIVSKGCLLVFFTAFVLMFLMLLTDLPMLATNEIGKVLNSLATRQNAMARPMKVGDQLLKRPVKSP
jgi:hypothetical protein